MIEQIQRVITSIAERVGTQGAAKESLGTVPASYQLVAELPQALREANTNGGYNDLSSCGLCDEKTKETRHGGAEKARLRP